MIDLHAHILPGIDDGARSFKESLQMIELAEEIGFDAVVATPHFYEGKKMVSTVAENTLLLKRLKKAAKAEGARLYLFPGNEVFYTRDTMEKIETGRFTGLNKSRYMLVEGNRHSLDCHSFERFLINLQAKGYTPVVAHPERYECIQENPNLLGRMINNGCYAQLNLLSLTGFYGDDVRWTAEILLDHEMIHFMASDAHKPRYYESIPRAIDLAKELIGWEAVLVLMDENPKRVLVNERVFAPEPAFYRQTPPKKRFFQQWVRPTF